jgi:hypothetical protein
MDIPPIADIKEFLENSGEWVNDNLNGVFDDYSVDQDEDAEDHIDATGHLDDTDKEQFEQELANCRRNAKVFDWLVYFLSKETDVLDPVMEAANNALDASNPPILQMEVDRG